MKSLTVAEIRTRYLEFFVAHGHAHLPSDSLVPANDPTLLFTGAGMNQFKDMFLGRGTLPHKRVTTAQKCLRVPDLERVGATPRHHTFFEMLGNFSFGDYFKRECIEWEWEFFTGVLGLPKDRLVVTVYLDDDEAFEVWHKRIGLAKDRIYRFGEKENFWPAEAPSKGPNGPCGPCSEIYFDAMPDQPRPANAGLDSLPDGRFTEIGNCVFTQFDRREDGSLPQLPQKNIDVGLGLERVGAVLQGVPNNYETDLFLPYLDFVARRSGRPYRRDSTDGVRMRRISDHIRATTFAIADGALPGNEGRGYVVRKILRRAVRDGYDLGITEPFLCDMVDVVGATMGDAYPEVRQHAGQCRTVLCAEEQSFVGVYKQGKARLEEFLAGQAQAPAGNVLAGSGEFSFELHDTFGFPVDITRAVMADRGFVLDEAAFDAAMEEQRRRARAAMTISGAVFAESAAAVLRKVGVPATEFVGYTGLAASTAIGAMLDGGNAVRATVGTGDEVSIALAKTPFYAQGGGQVGDRGSIATPTGRVEVSTTVGLEGYHLHRGKVVEGTVSAGQPCDAVVEASARRDTERNHTATHLLHAALKRTLGTHVSQAGSEVSPDRLRFDFTHGEKVSDEQIARLEDQVNEAILSALPVEPKHMPLAQARQAGFVAMFGEKYGDVVRTLTVGDVSRELCGGTHVANTGAIGQFRITSEAAVSAGTRRIEAVTGRQALLVARVERGTLARLSAQLKVPGTEVQERVTAILEEVKQLRKALEKATAADLDKLTAELRAAAVTSGERRYAVFTAPVTMTMKEVQDLLGRARQALAPFAGVVLAPGGEDVLVGAVVSPELTRTIAAGDLVKAATDVLGGGGGGRPEMAQGKGKDRSKVAAAAQRATEVLRQALAPGG